MSSQAVVIQSGQAERLALRTSYVENLVTGKESKFSSLFEFYAAPGLTRERITTRRSRSTSTYWRANSTCARATANSAPVPEHSCSCRRARRST